LQQGELSMVCVGLSERDLKNFGGQWPPWNPPSFAPVKQSTIYASYDESSCKKVIKNPTMVNWVRWRHKYNTTATGGGTFFKLGSTSAGQKIIANFFGLNWQLWRHKHWNITSLHIHRAGLKTSGAPG